MLIALFVCLPNTSYGATIGSEKPNIYCTYTDSDGKQYDGDKLPAGTYDVNFYLEGVSELSVVQVTAKYSADATVDTAAKSLLSNNIAGISSMGTITQNSNLVFGFLILTLVQQSIVMAHCLQLFQLLLLINVMHQM